MSGLIERFGRESGKSTTSLWSFARDLSPLPPHADVVSESKRDRDDSLKSTGRQLPSLLHDGESKHRCSTPSEHGFGIRSLSSPPLHLTNASKFKYGKEVKLIGTIPSLILNDVVKQMPRIASAPALCLTSCGQSISTHDTTNNRYQSRPDLGANEFMYKALRLMASKSSKSIGEKQVLFWWQFVHFVSMRGSLKEAETANEEKCHQGQRHDRHRQVQH